ncbi:MAG: 50S ribosomal protein L22 [Planctomycetes bacterium]|nr:50S ribosomal protein L22 [Planctomycetota bacterium]
MADEPKREFRASARNVRMSARKARLVMDAVRGRDADEAMVVLQYVNKRAAPAIRKLIESAMANAEEYGNRQGVDIDTGELVIATAYADEGPRMKRWRPRSRGMANPFTRYTCHMHVVLAERTWLDEKSKGRPAFAKPRHRVSKAARLAKKGIVVAADAAKAEKTAKPADKAVKADKKPAKTDKAEKKPAKKAASKSDKKTATKKKK